MDNYCGVYHLCEAALEIFRMQRNFSRWGKAFESIWLSHDLIIAKSSSVSLVWCPSHSGLSYNEMADAAAKEACRMPLPSNGIFPRKFLLRDVNL